jgi:Arc/MetJ-type ribon-helix-helix transcriptional regulator
MDMVVKKIGISVNESTYEAALEAVESGDFRNLSHVFEKAARLMLRDKLEGGQKPRDHP